MRQQFQNPGEFQNCLLFQNTIFFFFSARQDHLSIRKVTLIQKTQESRVKQAMISTPKVDKVLTENRGNI